MAIYNTFLYVLLNTIDQTEKTVFPYVISFQLYISLYGYHFQSVHMHPNLFLYIKTIYLLLSVSVHIYFSLLFFSEAGNGAQL